MNCPVCDTALRETDRHGIRVDICTSCKGIWLDRGELEKIIAATEQEMVPPFDPVPTERTRPRGVERERQPYDSRSRERYDDDRPRRRKSILSELFEVFGD
ncbi:MAG: hypothetical protein AMXMBFR61_25510 [Fimbriimonadales bacterium]